MSFLWQHHVLALRSSQASFLKRLTLQTLRDYCVLLLANVGHGASFLVGIDATGLGYSSSTWFTFLKVCDLGSNQCLQPLLAQNAHHAKHQLELLQYGLFVAVTLVDVRCPIHLRKKEPLRL